MSKIKKFYPTIKKRGMTGLMGDIQKINKKYYIIVRFVFCLCFVGKSSMNSLKGYLRQTTCIDKNIWTIPKTFKSVRFYMEKIIKIPRYSWIFGRVFWGSNIQFTPAVPWRQSSRFGDMALGHCHTTADLALSKAPPSIFKTLAQFIIFASFNS